MKKQVIFVGWVNYGKKPVCGETTKNQYILAELEKYCDVKVLDFYNKKAHPWIYAQAAWAFLTEPNATIVFSTSAQNVYSFLKLLKKIGLKRNIIHWVVGGAFPKLVKEGKFEKDIFNYVSLNVVQIRDMVEQLKEVGINNGKYVSNFKEIGYFPDLDNALLQRNANEVIRFVFLSRIMPGKGCGYIVDAVKNLNDKGYQNRFIVDFYGKFDSSYQEEFLKSIEPIKNVTYKGILNLKESKGYDVLATYHAMLFPTFHPSEGFSGIFIDAFIAGLPVFASDWAYNPECIENGKTGVIYPTHDVAALEQTMKDCIDGKIDLTIMAKNARAEASKYDAKNVLNEESIREIGLI